LLVIIPAVALFALAMVAALRRSSPDRDPAQNKTTVSA
jgi:hypothetical protein